MSAIAMLQTTGPRAALAVLACAGCIALPAHATTGWNETVSGDLSGDGLAPTLVSVALGSNLIFDTTGNAGSVSFICIQAGPSITPGGSQLLGFSHHGPETIGTNILPSFLSAGNPVLPSGNHAVWIQATGGLVTCSFDFVLAAVQEPAGALLLGLGMAGLLAHTRQTD